MIALAAVVYCPRNQLLACTGFTLNQHGRTGPSDQSNLPQTTLELRALSHNLMETMRRQNLFLKIYIFSFEPLFRRFELLQRLVQARPRFVARDTAREELPENT